MESSHSVSLPRSSHTQRIRSLTSTLLEQLAVRLHACLCSAKLVVDDAEVMEGGAGGRDIAVVRDVGEQLRQVVSTYLVIDMLPEMVTLYRQYALRPKLLQVINNVLSAQ